MNYILYLKGKAEINLSFREDAIVIVSSEGTEKLRFDDIREIHLSPVRRTSRYYFPPVCMIKTSKKKVYITTRGTVFRIFSSMLESGSDDVERMSKFVHELHGILVEKGLGESIRYLYGGPLLKGTLIVYPFILGFPVIVGFDWSPIVICIVVGVYVILAWLAKKRSYNPVRVAEDIKNASFYLS